MCSELFLAPQFCESFRIGVKSVNVYRIHLLRHLLLDFCLLEVLKITDSVSLQVIDRFIFSFFPGSVLRHYTFLELCAFLLRLSVLLEYNCCCMLSHFSRGQLFVTLWTTAHQSPLSMEFSRQEYWSGLPFPPPGDLPDPGIELMSLVSPAWAGGFFTTSATSEA